MTQSDAPVMSPLSLDDQRADHRLGHQHVWYWRGWRIRYTVLRPPTPAAQQQTPLLLLHGFGANFNQWRDNLLPLSQHRPVYAVDFLGFGGSEKAIAQYGTHLWSTQVFEFWQTFIGQPVVLLGHSLGALVALTTAIAHPGMAERLILLTLPAARQELVAGWLDTLSRTVEGVFATPLLMRPLFSLVRRPAFLRQALRGIYLDPSRVDEELVATFALPPQERGAARTLCYLVRSRTAPDFSPITHDLIEALQIPTLLLWGEQDRVIPSAWGEKIASLNPLLTFQRVSQAGHCFFDEQPEWTNQVIEIWLQSATASPAVTASPEEQ